MHSLPPMGVGACSGPLFLFLSFRTAPTAMSCSSSLTTMPGFAVAILFALTLCLTVRLVPTDANIKLCSARCGFL